MKLPEIFLIALSLSMDAFAVALCKGLSLVKAKIKSCFVVGCWFGLFQGLMTFLGYHLGGLFSDKITEYDHIVSFLLLSFLGINMLREAISKNEKPIGSSLRIMDMLILSLATSIDAFTVGVSFAFTNFKCDFYIYLSIFIISVTTFVISFLGVKIGNIFGIKYKSKAEILGGATLILLGIKSLFEK